MFAPKCEDSEARLGPELRLGKAVAGSGVRGTGAGEAHAAGMRDRH